MPDLNINGNNANSSDDDIEKIGYNTPATYESLQDQMDEVKENLTNIDVYVGEDKKLHFVNSEGADSVIPFSKGIKILDFGIEGQYGGLALDVTDYSIFRYTLPEGGVMNYQLIKDGVVVQNWTGFPRGDSSIDISNADRLNISIVAGNLYMKNMTFE